MSAEQDQSKPPHHRAIRSFVLRTGRMTAAQTAALEQHWAQYGLRTEDGPLDKRAVFSRHAPLTIEIGFGMGDSLLAMAEAMPERDFIGIEVHTPGVGRLLAGAAEKGLQNLRVYRADAVQVLQRCVPDGSVDCFQIFFPDPWPKKKHHKRRLIQAPFLAVLHDKLRSGGCLHIATDWQDYARQCMALLEASEQWRNQQAPGQFSERPGTRPKTKFEQRGQRLGHGVWDLLFGAL